MEIIKYTPDIQRMFNISQSNWSYWVCISPNAVGKVGRGTFERDKVIRFLTSKGYKRIDQPNSFYSVPVIDWLTKEDLPELFKLEFPFFGDRAICPCEMRKLLEINPYICLGCFSSDRSELWGVIKMYPVASREVAESLMRKGTSGYSLLGGLVDYSEERTYDLYIGSVVMRPGKEALFSNLVRKVTSWWLEEMYPSNKKIGRIYAKTISEDGQALALSYGFSIGYVNGGEEGYGVVESGMVLDMAVRNNRRFIRNFQENIKSIKKP